VSGERAFGQGLYVFKEVARRLPAIGQANVKLKVRLGTTHGKPDCREPGAPGDGEEGVGALESRRAVVMNDEVARRRGLTHEPVSRHPCERIAARPARGIERLKLEGRAAAQLAPKDERIAPAAQATERPPRQIARFEEDDHCHLCELGFALVYDHLYGGRAQPTHGGALTERGQAPLQPAQSLASKADIPDRAGGEPGDDSDRGDADKLRHGGRNDSTPVARGWKRALREFLYGLTGYEIAQQALEIRATMETLFMLGVFGDMLGVPVLPPYYGLRLLPFVVPQIETWKRRVLRERELGTDHEHHLHGV